MVIYPAIDVRGGRCVRLQQGDYGRETVFSDDPLATARGFVAQGADRLHLVDLDGAKAGRPVNGAVIARVAAGAGVPCQVGGGLRTLADLGATFALGVRWAVIGTKALESPDWLIEAATRFPGRIVLGVDARDGRVATGGWLATSEVRAADLVALVEAAPLAAIVFTDIARDGMLTGPNLDATLALQAATRHPVVASGGVGSVEQVLALRAAGVAGCVIGRALYEGAVALADVLAPGSTLEFHPPAGARP